MPITMPAMSWGEIRREARRLLPGCAAAGAPAGGGLAEDLIGVLLTQRAMSSPQSPRVFQDFWTTAYAAIDD
jgi:hypothetical protein